MQACRSPSASVISEQPLEIKENASFISHVAHSVVEPNITPSPAPTCPALYNRTHHAITCNSLSPRIPVFVFLSHVLICPALYRIVSHRIDIPRPDLLGLLAGGPLLLHALAAGDLAELLLRSAIAAGRRVAGLARRLHRVDGVRLGLFARGPPRVGPRDVTDGGLPHVY